MKKKILVVNFAPVTAVFFSLFITGQAILFYYVIYKNSETVKKTMLDSKNEMLLEKTQFITNQLERQKPKNFAEGITFIKSSPAFCSDLLYILVFSPTDDENYFMLEFSAPINTSMQMLIDKENPVRESSSFLKKSRFKTQVDPAIYFNEGYSWQNLYAPAIINGRPCIIQYMFKASLVLEITDSFNTLVNRSGNIMLIASVLLMIGVILLMLIFSNTQSTLIKNLSSYIRKAAKGEDLNINMTGSNELDELADAFNGLVAAIKDEKKPGKAAGKLFEKGVELLKANRMAESIPLFETALLFNPLSFSSSFNLGVAMAKTGNYAGALAMFKKAYDINPEYELTAKYIYRVEKMLERNAGKS